MPPLLLSLRLLGPLELWRGAAQVELLRSKKTRALLAYLVATGRAHRRDRLAALFWDVTDDPKAALRWSLSKIRSLVSDEGAQRIVTEGDTVRFDPAGAEVDVRDVEAAVGRGLDALEVAELDELVARFRGIFLEGLDLADFPEFQAWLVAQREHWKGVRERLLRVTVDRLSDDPEAALDVARQLVQIAPADESARAALVRLLFTTGRRDEANEHHRMGLAELSRFRVRETGELRAALRSAAAPPVASAPEGPGAEAPRQTIRFCTASDGARIAYASLGEGPFLVKAANWLTHLEYDWKSPLWRHLALELGRDRCLVRYDERGNGLSDWEAPISFDAFVDDLETVVDAVGAERFDLLGVSQGSRTAIAYAVKHPERVRRLVIYGGAVRGWRRRPPEAVARRQALATLMRQGWDESNSAFVQLFTNLFMPGATAEQVEWFNELQQVACSGANAAKIADASSDVDLTDVLADISVPTLVMHATGDAMVPFGEARSLAAGIPGARFVSLESPNHLLLGDEPAWGRFISELRSFLAE